MAVEGGGSGGSVLQPYAQTPGNLTAWHGSLTTFWERSHYRHTLPTRELALPPCEWTPGIQTLPCPPIGQHLEVLPPTCPVTVGQLCFGHLRELLHHPLSQSHLLLCVLNLVFLRVLTMYL